ICPMVVVFASSRITYASLSGRQRMQASDASSMPLHSSSFSTFPTPTISYMTSYSPRRNVSTFCFRSRGSKPSFLRASTAGRSRRAHQDQALHPGLVQRLHRAGHGEEGLAGAGRADAEVDVVGGDRVQVLLLVGTAAADGAALDADGDLLRHETGVGAPRLEHLA